MKLRSAWREVDRVTREISMSNLGFRVQLRAQL